MCVIFKMATATDTTLVVKAYPNQECFYEADSVAEGLGFTLEDSVFVMTVGNLEDHLQAQHNICVSGYFLNFTSAPPEEERRMYEPDTPKPRRYVVSEQYFTLTGMKIDRMTVAGIYMRAVTFSDGKTFTERVPYLGNN